MFVCYEMYRTSGVDNRSLPNPLVVSWLTHMIIVKVTCPLSGFGGLEDACWPLVPKFTGSNPAEAVGFFRAKKSPARLPSEGK
jgi:hypothetical protein